MKMIDLIRNLERKVNSDLECKGLHQIDLMEMVLEILLSEDISVEK
jgi:hypothetical protein